MLDEGEGDEDGEIVEDQIVQHTHLLPPHACTCMCMQRERESEGERQI